MAVVIAKYAATEQNNTQNASGAHIMRGRGSNHVVGGLVNATAAVKNVVEPT